MFVVTYSSDHNHPWPPVSKNHHHHGQHHNPSHGAAEDHPMPDKTSAVEAASETEEKFTDLITEVLVVEFQRRAALRTSVRRSPNFDESYKFGSSQQHGSSLQQLQQGHLRWGCITSLADWLSPSLLLTGQMQGSPSQMRGGGEGKRCRLEMEDVAVATAGAASTWCGSTG